MSAERISIITAFLHRVKAANKEHTKKELFKDLLNRLYSGSSEIEKIIDAMSLGAETTIFNIPRKDKLHKGSADTLYNKILIEFENDLKSSLPHAKIQLAGYFLGQLRSGGSYNFTLIASDFINWKVLTPHVSFLDKLDTVHEDELVLDEVGSSSFTLTETNAEDFYFWIDRFLFRKEKQKATLKGIEDAFGFKSPIFIECFRQLINEFEEVKKFGEVQVSYEQWRKFLSIAYGTFDDTPNEFVIHTYLSVFAKILAYEVVSHESYISDDEMKGILEGAIFNKYNIKDFVENDFFHWVKNERNFRNLRMVFRLITQEIATFDFTTVEEDILKGVYQELIDLDTRHALGEYYTPDWLCERIVKEFNFKRTDKILDPACGSGSFLRAVIHRIRKLNPTITAEEVNAAIYGIDIHPLSVQIAKTTMLISLGKEVTSAKKPIHFNIILANTLLAPEGVRNLFGGEFLMNIDKEKCYLNTTVFDDVNLFDDAIETCNELAEQTQGKEIESEAVLKSILKQKNNGHDLLPAAVESFYKVYKGLKIVKEKGRNSIWKFILQNLYKPYFLKERFDYIIGNPPWLTYSSIKNEEYQNTLNEIAKVNRIKPERAANFPHLEIAAIFLSYCSEYFMKKSGKLSFVLPRSFFNADHHDNTRRGAAKGFRITDIWDLEKVSPLFRIPSCVLFAEKALVEKRLPEKGLAGKSFAGKLPFHNCNLIAARPVLSEEDVRWYYSKQGKSSAFTNKKIKRQIQVNPYKRQFKQGATIVPRTFYFVELNQAVPPDFHNRILNLRTSAAILPDAKQPWKEIKLSGKIESSFLYRTAISKSILPFALYKPDLVVLPIIIKTDKNKLKKINLLSESQVRKEGFLDAARWFHNCENIWNIHRTEKNRKISSENYLNWQSKLTEQKLNTPFLVLYNASAKDANATIVKRKELDLEFLVESTTYVYYPNNLTEGYYLTAVLNSLVLNAMMKDFQAKGLFGPRHVHKKILDIYFPKFNGKDKIHLQISALGKLAHEKVGRFLKNNPPQKEIGGIHLGKLRVEIKKHLVAEMKEIDKLVSKIIE